MQHHAVFRQGLYCLLRLTQLSVVELHHNLETFTYESFNPIMPNGISLYYQWDQSTFVLSVVRW